MTPGKVTASPEDISGMIANNETLVPIVQFTKKKQRSTSTIGNHLVNTGYCDEETSAEGVSGTTTNTETSEPTLNFIEQEQPCTSTIGNHVVNTGYCDEETSTEGVSGTTTNTETSEPTLNFTEQEQPCTSLIGKHVTSIEESDEESLIEDSESSYMPSESDESSESDTSYIYPEQTAETLPIEHLQVETGKISTNTRICVTTTNNKHGRSYDKIFYCPYCLSKQSKLPRHLEGKHKEESDVAKCLATKDKLARKTIMTKLRNLGNHLHNAEVIGRGSGELIVAYRPTGYTSWNEYVPCEYCLGYYVKKELWQHVKRCDLAPSQGKHKRVLQRARLLLPAPESSSRGYNEIFSSMRTDSIGLCCKGDPLIRKFGERLYLKYGHDKEQFPSLRNTLRELARLLLNLRNTVGPSGAGLQQFITPTSFQDVIFSTRQIAGFNDNTHTYSIPTLAKKLGGSLKTCAGIVRRDAMISQDESLKQQAHDFLNLIEMEWKYEVNSHAHRTLNERTRNKIKYIPLVKDTMLLSAHLRSVGNRAAALLQHSNDASAWMELNEVTLARVILFNRRRQGEASKLTIEDFKKINHTRQGDAVACLSALEKDLTQRLQRVEIVGKRGRIVPLLLTSEISSWINLLVAKRDIAGVHQENIYVFARNHYGSLGHIRGSDVLRETSQHCGAQEPELLRSTKLRKQIGTLSQILNLRDHELDILANFMGHDIRVHREYYRLPEETLQVAKVSKLLLTLEHGQYIQQKGRNLDEIEVDLHEDIDLGGVKSDDQSSEDERVLEENPKRGCRFSPRYIDGSGSTSSSEDDDDIEVVPRKKRRRKGLSKLVKRPWSEHEKAAVLRHLEKFIMLKKLPGKREIDRCLSQEPCLRERTWRNVKDFVRNRTVNKNSH